MTDKELRKLNRLELLEMLLQADKENKTLKETIVRLTTENESAKQIENLNLATEKVNEALDQANRLIETIKTNNSVAPSQKKERTDKNLYLKILKFLCGNESAIDAFPAELKEEIKTRAKELFKNKNNS